MLSTQRQENVRGCLVNLKKGKIRSENDVFTSHDLCDACFTFHVVN